MEYFGLCLHVQGIPLVWDATYSLNSLASRMPFTIGTIRLNSFVVLSELQLSGP